jgi:type IV pilus assembly protein PilE
MSTARGFTLIELLVTILILGVLMGIALANFSSTVNKTADGAALSDLRNAMNAQESYFVDNEAYAAPASLAIVTSEGVELGGAASVQGYVLTARHRRSNATYVITVGSGSTTDGAIHKQ